jgi:hypothetical protein
VCPERICFGSLRIFWTLSFYGLTECGVLREQIAKSKLSALLQTLKIRPGSQVPDGQWNRDNVATSRQLGQNQQGGTNDDSTLYYNYLTN